MKSGTAWESIRRLLRLLQVCGDSMRGEGPGASDSSTEKGFTKKGRSGSLRTEPVFRGHRTYGILRELRKLSK